MPAIQLAFRTRDNMELIVDPKCKQVAFGWLNTMQASQVEYV